MWNAFKTIVATIANAFIFALALSLIMGSCGMLNQMQEQVKYNTMQIKNLHNKIDTVKNEQ